MINWNLNGNRAGGPSGTALLFVLSALILFGGAGPEPSFEQNRRRIELLQAAERTRLERNLRTFLEMPGEQRNADRSFHREIQDDARSGGKLRDLLQAYNAWLATLSPYQRQEILNVADPVARAQLVRKIRQEQ